MDVVETVAEPDPLDKLMDTVYLSNLLTSLDLISFIPLLELWDLEFTDDEDVQNACFRFRPSDQRAMILFNRKWCRENIKSSEEMVTVLMHEAFHFLLGYYGSTYDWYLVEAWECFINQMIYVVTGGSPAYLGILERLFEKEEFPRNFRCGSANPKGYIQGRIYECLYGYNNPGTLPPFVKESETHKKYGMYSRTYTLPRPCFLLDPVTLSELFASMAPGKPRTKEEWQEQTGEVPVYGAPIDPNTPLGKMLGELSGMGQSTVGENPEGGDPSDLGEGDGGGITNLPPSRILTAGQAATMLEQLGKAFVKEIQDIQSSSGSSHASTFEKRYTKKIEPIEIRRMKKEVGNARPLKYIATGLTRLSSDGAIELNPEEFGTAAGSGGVPGIFHAGSRQKLFLRKSKMKEDLERISTLDAQGKIDCFFRSKVKKVPTKTPTPSFRRDRLATALISQGRAPSMYRSSTPKNPSGLVHLYIDVSGSCTQFIPKFLDFMEPMKDLCHEVCHIFSTEVYDVSRDELIRSRNYKSTGGTSLSCILDHMKKNKIHLACVMSDGYMSATDEEMKWAKETRVDVVTLTTPGAATTCQLYDLSTIVSSLENYTKDRRKGGSSK